MMCCFNPTSGGDVHGGRGGNIDRSKVVYDANPSEHRDTFKGGQLSRRRRIYGRDDERDEIKSLLLAPSGGDNPSVVSVVGIGGLGKTTLARVVYNDDEVEEHFQARAWFRVSEELDMRSLLTEIVRSTGGNPEGYEDIRVAVGGKRLLLVLDDVWENGIEDLIQLINCLMDVQSKIIVTTRSGRVATVLGGEGGTLYNLKGLLDEDCWKLFKQNAFHVGREETEQLERIGREIVDKLQGVPLTVIAVGSLLQFERDRSVWENVRDSQIWELPEVANRTLSALKLSYDHLPSHLRRCFEYCSLFPKGHKILREKVVELWMAEGLTSSSAASILPEDVGDGYVDELLLRSFFQEEEEHDRVGFLKMHDLFHDLAQSIVGDEHVSVEANKAILSSRKGCRRLVLLCRWQTSAISGDLCRFKRLETLVLLMRDAWIESTYKCSVNQVPREIFSGLRYLRLLDLSCLAIEELPESISKLKHLRFLNLSGTRIETLPESIGRLKNLCTLKLESCQELRRLPNSVKNLRSLEVLILDTCILLQELPEGIWNLRNLTHLQIDGCLSLAYLPKGIGRVAGLQVLSLFPMDEEHGSRITELQHLNLKGHINISNLGSLRNPADAMAVNMKGKPHLRRMALRWKVDYAGERIHWAAAAGYSGDDGRDVLEGFQPHPNLKELIIGGYWGMNFPSWMAPNTVWSSLSNLAKITLEIFGVCKALPPLGELPSLKTLKILAFDALEHLGAEFYGTGAFPSLEIFEICRMPQLEEWVLPVDGTGRDMFPRLTYLEVDRCPRIRSIPSLPSLEVLSLSKTSEELLSSGGEMGWSLPSLKTLYISYSTASSRRNGLPSLPAIETLVISYCTESRIPDSVQQLTTLRNLRILHCHNLAALPLWLENFSLLKTLQIHFCSKLSNLPAVIQRIPSLRTLQVRGDSSLWDQYMIGEEDWKDQHDITHVPNVTFEMWADFDCQQS